MESIKKMKIKHIFFIILIILVEFISAQGNPGGPGGPAGGCWPPPCIPIDGGLTIFTLLSIVFGYKIISKSK